MAKVKKFHKVLLALLIYVAGIVICTTYMYRRDELSVLETYDKLITAAAYGAAQILGDDFHDRTESKNSISPKEDRKNIKKLTRLANELGIAYIYTVIINKDENAIVTAASSSNEELANEKAVRYFTGYKSAPEELKKVFKSDKITFLDYTDQWGHYRSVYIPLRSTAGKVYVACADVEIAKISSSLESILYRSLILAGIFLLLAIPLIWAFNDIRVTQGVQLQEKQKQLAHAGRLTAMGEMAAGIAHEINQPLCVIRGYLELLRSVLKDNSDLKEKKLENAFDISIASVEKASNIINHMRKFARVKNQEPKPIDMTVPLESALLFFHEQIRLHNIDLKKNYEENLPEVRLDPQRFEQIAVNFISNARFAVDKKSELKKEGYKKEVELTLYSIQDKKRVVFEIRDNGIGMSKKTMENCFEPFYTTKGVDEGTGLGLSIVRDIVHEFDGVLEIESKEGVGTVCKAIFPASSE